MKEQAKPRRVDVTSVVAADLDRGHRLRHDDEPRARRSQPLVSRASGAAPSATSRVRRAVAVPDDAAPLYTVSQAAAMLDVPTAFLRRLDSRGRRHPRPLAGRSAPLQPRRDRPHRRPDRLMAEGMTLAGAQRIIELENEIADLRRRLAARDVADQEKRGLKDRAGWTWSVRRDTTSGSETNNAEEAEEMSSHQAFTHDVESTPGGATITVTGEMDLAARIPIDALAVLALQPGQVVSLHMADVWSSIRPGSTAWPTSRPTSKRRERRWCSLNHRIRCGGCSS